MKCDENINGHDAGRNAAMTTTLYSQQTTSNSDCRTCVLVRKQALGKAVTFASICLYDVLSQHKLFVIRWSARLFRY